MIVPSFSISDQIQHTCCLGNTKELQVFLILGNINSMIRWKPLNLPTMLCALLHVPPKYHSEWPGKSADVNKQQIHNQEILCKVFNLISHHLGTQLNMEIEIVCADGRIWQWYQSAVSGHLTTWKTVTYTWSSSPTALWANHWNYCFQK